MMRNSAYFAVVLCVLAAQVAHAQPEPVWTQIPVTFYNYSTVAQPVQTNSFSFSLYFPGPAVTNVPDALGCRWNSFVGQPTGVAVGGSNGTSPNYPRWVTAGSPNSGTIPRGNPPGGAAPGEFDASVGAVFQDPVRSDTKMKGVSFLGSFSPAADSQGAPIQTVFWESDSCADGDTEYGFFQQSGFTVFYYSYWTNCPDPGGSMACIEAQTGQQVTPCVGGFTFPTLPASSNGQYFFNAFPYQDSSGAWWFKAEALDGQSTKPLYSCKINPAVSSDPNNPDAGTFNCLDENNMSSKPATVNNVTTTATPGVTTSCSIVPPGNSNTFFNPGWTYGVYGSLFAAVAGGENDNNPLSALTPFTVTALKAGK